MEVKLNLLLIVLILCLLVVSGYLYFFHPQQVHLFQEYEIYSKRDTGGKSWHIIRNEESRKHYMNIFGINIPDANFDDHYLLLSDGRKIMKIVYLRYTKYTWGYHVPKGDALFATEHNDHTVYVYKIDKVMLKQEGN